jgi:hypothetical protein
VITEPTRLALFRARAQLDCDDGPLIVVEPLFALRFATSKRMPGMINLALYDKADFDDSAPKWKQKLWVVVRCILFQTPWP